MKRWKLFLPLVFFLAFCVLLLAGLFMENKNELPSMLLNKPLPEFSLPTLRDPQQVVTQDKMKGQVYLLNIWASWCAACRVEHPVLNDLAKQGVNIVGVNYKDDSRNAHQWLERLSDPYLFNIQDSDGRLALNLGVYGAPETFLVDRKGIIRYKHVGVVDQRVWNEDLKPLYETLEKESVQ